MVSKEIVKFNQTFSNFSFEKKNEISSDDKFAHN